MLLYPTMKTRLAGIISNIFNPFLLGFIVMVLAVIRDTVTVSETIKWITISLLFSIIPVLLVVAVLVHRKKLDGMFVSPRSQRKRVYILAACIGLVGLVLVWLLEAPMLVKALFSAGVAAILIFMVVNCYWKISLHTAFISASATVLSIIYGIPGLIAFILVPAVAWSRVVLRQHTLAQVIAGGISAAAIVIAVFAGCGCIN